MCFAKNEICLLNLFGPLLPLSIPRTLHEKRQIKIAATNCDAMLTCGREKMESSFNVLPKNPHVKGIRNRCSIMDRPTLCKNIDSLKIKNISRLYIVSIICEPK